METPIAETSNETPAAAPEPEKENVLLFYPDGEENPGPGTFVMHGVNLFFRRGALTGPVTATVAGVVTDRKKPPKIRIATEADVKAAGESSGIDISTIARFLAGDEVGSSAATTTSAGTTQQPSTEKTDDAPATTSSTGPDDPNPDAAAKTERKPRQGTTLAKG